MSNIQFDTTLFTNESDNVRAPQYTGFVSIPVSQLEQLVELLKQRKVFVENGVDTVRLPLSFWTAQGRAPLAFRGKSSFQVLEGSPITQKMSVTVDKAPAIS